MDGVYATHVTDVDKGRWHGNTGMILLVQVNSQQNNRLKRGSSLFIARFQLTVNAGVITSL